MFNAYDLVSLLDLHTNIDRINELINETDRVVLCLPSTFF
jgi:hypothetical protein